MDLALTSGVRELTYLLSAFSANWNKRQSLLNMAFQSPKSAKADSTYNKSIQQIMKKENAISEIVVTDRKEIFIIHSRNSLENLSNIERIGLRKLK